MLKQKPCTVTHRSWSGGGERGTERNVYTLPNTRRAAGSVDHGGGVGAAEGLGGASRSVRPQEKVCSFSITVRTISSYR